MNPKPLIALGLGAGALFLFSQTAKAEAGRQKVSGPTNVTGTSGTVWEVVTFKQGNNTVKEVWLNDSRTGRPRHLVIEFTDTGNTKRVTKLGSQTSPGLITTAKADFGVTS